MYSSINTTKLLRLAKHNKNISMRAFASAVGKFRSCHMMVLLTQLRTQYLMRKLNHMLVGRTWAEVNWDAIIPALIPAEISELNFWARDLKRHNGRPIHDPLPNPNLITASDASGVGGGMIIMVDSPLYVDRPFDARWHFRVPTGRGEVAHHEARDVGTTYRHQSLVPRFGQAGLPLHDLVWLNRTDNKTAESY